jgi:uncharacterized protein
VPNLPTLELLRATHSFPGPYTFKAIGPSSGGFAARVVAAAREALKAPVDPPFRTRESEGGKHIAVTLDLTLASAEQVLKVYEHILEVRGLIMLM